MSHWNFRAKNFIYIFKLHFSNFWFFAPKIIFWFLNSFSQIFDFSRQKCIFNSISEGKILSLLRCKMRLFWLIFQHYDAKHKRLSSVEMLNPFFKMNNQQVWRYNKQRAARARQHCCFSLEINFLILILVGDLSKFSLFLLTLSL